TDSDWNTRPLQEGRKQILTVHCELLSSKSEHKEARCCSLAANAHGRRRYEQKKRPTFHCDWQAANSRSTPAWFSPEEEAEQMMVRRGTCGNKVRCKACQESRPTTSSPSTPVLLLLTVVHTCLYVKSSKESTPVWLRPRKPLGRAREKLSSATAR
ncbi:hypothetical protein AVEN_132959-1, partial [Araneus ventricosus]